jgi:hypothetical protein
MSFFNDASLAFLPSGAAGKDGKAYSIKPTNGDGDFTFSRGSNLSATRVGADGLIEKGRENLLLQSNNFGTTWQTINASVTSGQSGYDGSSDAWLLTSTGGPLYQSISESGVVTFSVYAKANSGAGFLLRVDQTTQTKLEFNISTGAFISGSNYIDYNSTSIGNGWYRLSVVFLAASTTTAQFRITDGSGTNISGSAYIQDAQLEIGLAATDYIESGASTGKAGLLEDEPRFDYSGGATCPSLLLEPSRTNLVPQSEYFDSWAKIGTPTITTNYGISPDGSKNSTRFESVSDRIYTNVGSIAANETFSLYMKGSGNVLIVLGNTNNFNQVLTSEWQRYEFKTTQAGTNDAIQIRGNGTALDMEIWGAQYEAGSYPTSYIPNHSGGTITRNFDYSIVESLGYSSTCTFYYEFNTTTGRDTSSPFAEIGKDHSNKIWIKGASADSPQFSVQGNGIFSGSISVTNEVSGTNKIAVQWSSGVGVVFSNGVKQNNTLTNSNTSENIDFIVMKGNGTSHDSKQLLFFEEALSDADCITLTTI